MNTVGMKTAERTRAMAIIGPETSSMVLERRLFWRHAFIHVPFHGLHHDNGIIDYQAYGQNQAENG